MDSKIIEIIHRIKEVFLDSLPAENIVSIFLCGGNTTDESRLRRRLGYNISQIHSKYQYSVYYPEDMFVELILGHQHKDLLKLEDLLAKGVHSVVILLQSPGTFTELGAFTNYSALKDKLVVVVEPKYRFKRSFISLGPIRYLQQSTRSKVIYTEMINSNVNNLTKLISEACREIARHSTPINDLTNPISSQKFFLALIYVFDPICRSDVIDIAQHFSNGDMETILTVTDSVLNGLINERKALSFSNQLSITPKGINALVYDSVLKYKSRKIVNTLSNLRLEVLNLILRKRMYQRIYRRDGVIAT